MIKLKSSIRDYYVHFEETPEFIGNFASVPQACYAVDQNVWRLYADTLLRGIDPENVLVLHAQEERKSLETVLEVYNYLIKRSAKRNMTLISIGGGIIQDITGFACSTLYRGINWIFVPTTLLAQADSCIGSKTSLNYLSHKNLVGSFYPPSHVHIYTPFLNTLEDEYFFSGLGEAVKLSITGGERVMREMVDLLPGVLRRTPESLAACVHRQDRPPAVFEAQHFQRPRVGVDEPGVCHSLARVDRELLRAIELRGRGRQNLADPVRRQGEVGTLRVRGHARAPPAGPVRHEHIVGEVEFRLQEDPPSARAAAAFVERRDQAPPEHRRRGGVE